MKVLVTGAKGFIGRNLISHLQHRKDIEIFGYDIDNRPDDLAAWLDEADFVYHLAGVNRPQREEEFFEGNTDFTRAICDRLARRADPPPILLSSSIQAELDNPYGRSKRLAEEAVARYGQETGARAIIYRLTNVFGKWSRPNYNTVVATFCYNIAHDLPITISNSNHEVRLIHIDDVVRAFISVLQRSEVRGQSNRGQSNRGQRSELQRSEVRAAEGRGQRAEGQILWRSVEPEYPVTLGQLAELIRSFRAMRQTLLTPNFSDPFVKKLYGMYLTYLDENDFAYDLTQRCDERGCLSEFIKSQHFGQIFVSRTKPGVTRGNHFHHTKVEKFLVLEGEAVIRFRKIQSDGGQRSEVRGQRSEVRTTEVRGQRSEVRTTEVRGQRSEVRTTEVRGQRPEVIEYRVSGKEFRVLDIPPGYTHNIENVGDTELITLFWASEIFDPDKPDTFYEEV